MDRLQIKSPNKYFGYEPDTKKNSFQNLLSVQTSTCKDFIQEINKQSDVEFYDILLYKAMQPYPLRMDKNRIKVEGDYAKNAPDLRKNFIKLLKYNTIQSYMEKTG